MLSAEWGELVSLPPYRILAKLAEGGVSRVYLAQDAESPGKQLVALSLIRSHYFDAFDKDLWSHRLSELRTIRHRNLAQVLDGGIQEGQAFVATEYVRGVSLFTAVRERRFTENEIASMAVALASALEALHRRGLLHLGLKPNKVILTDERPVLLPVVAPVENRDHRGTGWLLGTPGFIAPEVLIGDYWTPAGDIYALGSTLGFAATGRGIFGVRPSVGMMERVRRGEPDLEGTPVRIRSLIESMIEVDPLRRPSALEVVRHARKILKSSSQSAEIGTLARLQPESVMARPPYFSEAGMEPVLTISGGALVRSLLHGASRALDLGFRRFSSSRPRSPLDLARRDEEFRTAALEYSPIDNAGASKQEGASRASGHIIDDGRARLIVVP